MKHITLLPLFTALAFAFKVDLQSGTICTGENLASISVSSDVCYGFGQRTGHHVSSAYITYTGMVDDGYIIEFHNTEDCTGEVVAEGSGGCLGTYAFGQVNSMRRVPVPSSGKRSLNNTTPQLGAHDTWNRARVAANLKPDSMPDAEEGLHWLTPWPGHWFQVPENMTMTDFMETYKFDHNATFPDLNFLPDDEDDEPDSDAGNSYGNGTSPNVARTSGNALEDRSFKFTCSTIYYCAIPYFVDSTAYRIYKDKIAPIINSSPVQFIWSAANNGYIQTITTHYFYTKTTNTVPAELCSSQLTQKDAVISSLLQQLQQAQRQNAQVFEALGQCLDTNQPNKPKKGAATKGSLSFDAYSSMVAATRCNKPDCE